MNKLIVLKLGKNPRIHRLDYRWWGKNRLWANPDPESKHQWRLALHNDRIIAPSEGGYHHSLNTVYGFDEERVLAGAREALTRDLMTLERRLDEAREKLEQLDRFLADRDQPEGSSD